MSRLSSEDRRQIVHVTMGAWAVLLRWMTWPQAAALAAVALAFNWLVLPHIGGRSLYRAGDHARGYPAGILLYPFAVLILVLLFRERLDIVAAAWGVLAAGDGFASIVGSRLPAMRLPWNVEKTAAGTSAFIVCGTVAGGMLGWWASARFTTDSSLAAWILMAFVASLVAGLVETIPVRLDDNISVTASAALALACIDAGSASVWALNAGTVLMRTAPGLALNAAVAAIGWKAGTVSPGGVAAGILIGTIIFACAGTGAWVLLLASFAAAAAASRFGYKRKLQLGIAEERGGRRSAPNALANTGVAAVAAILAAASPYRTEALLALAAALIAGSSDTVASEIGKAYGRRTFLIVSFRRVPPGTSGALSLEGTAAGIAAAAVLATIALRTGLIAQPLLLTVVVAATAASLLESALGATLEGPRVLNNDLLNFINTAAAAGFALLLAARH